MKQNNNFFGTIVISLILTGCAASDSADVVNPNVTPLIGTRNYLRPVSVSGNVIETENRFLSLAKSVNRVSIINPDQMAETWHQSVTDFDYAVALPDFLGVTLVASNKVVVMSGDVSKEFTLNLSFAHATAASNSAAYSSASIDGTSFEVIRSLTNGVWQHDTFTVPWNPIDPNIVAPPAGQPVLLVSQYNADGTMLAVFSPADGRYAVYTAASASDPILPTSMWCNGDGVGTPQNASFRSLIWDENRQVFFAGDKNGSIYALDPKTACPTASTVNSLAMPNNSQIIHIGVYDNGNLGVMQTTIGTTSQIGIVSFNNGALTDTGQQIILACERPFSSTSTFDSSTRNIVVMCRQNSTTPVNTGEEAFAATESYIYTVHDYNTGAYINTVSLDPVKTAGVAIDRSTHTLYRMDESAFGVLETINLLNGESTNTVGLFISELLD